jgi:peptidoglycan/xylan/chitin deacetylase (PgdA/CDA1 family)
MKGARFSKTPLPRGIFTLSLDFELLWGTIDLYGTEGFRRACETERAVVIDRLLDLLAANGVRATWCIVGHLFLERCPGESPPRHPEIVRPRHAWFPEDWFERDPGGTEATQPLFLARSLVEKIRACRVPQEIGCHSFSHAIFGDPGCSRAAAQSEVLACVRAAAEMGIELRSFAFPRNSVGHLDVLRQFGFTCYRGPGPRWYESDDSPGMLRRLAHLADVLAAASPPTVLPELTEAGLWNIPGSMIYFPMHGLRRYIPVSRRVERARKGLEHAARRREVFHLWFHPTNLADGTDGLFSGLRDILGQASSMKESGALDIMSMAGIAERSAALAPEIAPA